ncbi:MAG: proline iminopeptidase-family hydrolase [Victivallaceae bacterium]|nr:proline iminopeptidase-family hydrolase [Victivallaceae bacterium]
MARKSELAAGKRQEGHVQVSGGKIWYGTAGGSGKGVPLVVIHGGPGASHDYLEPLEALAESRPVIFYDQLDCGNSDRPGDPEHWTVERYVDELHELITALGLGRVHLLGQSWGAAIAAEYALSGQGDAVASLVLSGPMLSTPRWDADQRKYIAMLPDAVRNTITASEASGDFATPAYQEAMMYYYRLHVCRLECWPDCLTRTFEKVSAGPYVHMWGPSEFTINGTLRNYDLSGRLREISVPVLLTCGEHDEAAPSTVEYFRSLIPGAELRVFSGASHEHHLEKTAEYLAAVQSFLGRGVRPTACSKESPW